MSYFHTEFQAMSLLANDGVVSPFSSEIYEYILKMMLSRKGKGLKISTVTDFKDPIDLDPNYVKAFTGRYKSGPRLVSFVEMDGKLAVISR